MKGFSTRTSSVLTTRPLQTPLMNRETFSFMRMSASETTKYFAPRHLRSISRRYGSMLRRPSRDLNKIQMDPFHHEALRACLRLCS